MNRNARRRIAEYKEKQARKQRKVGTLYTLLNGEEYKPFVDVSKVLTVKPYG